MMKRWQTQDQTQDAIQKDFARLYDALYPLPSQVSADLQALYGVTLNQAQEEDVLGALDLLVEIATAILGAIEATYDIQDHGCDWIADDYARQIKDELSPIVGYITGYGEQLLYGTFRQQVLTYGGDFGAVLNRFG